jgi:asparagine synthase (glutamine-hydrolysing)
MASPAPVTPGISITYAFGRGADDPLSLRLPPSDWYPIDVIEDHRRTIVLDGRVYGGRQPALLRQLREIPNDADNIARTGRAIRDLCHQVDGDFGVVWNDHETARLVIAGDFFGRLPLYYRATRERLVVSRNQRDLLDAADENTVDRMALSQVILFGYPLRERTLIDGVSRLLPGEVIAASPDGFELLASPGSPFRRAADVPVPKSPEGCARVLRDAFVASCRDRHIDTFSQVLSLSGGIDSRTTGAGMREVFGRFASVTFHAPDSFHADENAWASRVARILGSDWRSYQLDCHDARDIDDIVSLKLGLNPASVGFGLEYVRRVHGDFPSPIAFWTGEGADKLLCEHRAIPGRPNMDELVAFIVAKNGVWDPSQVAAITGVPRDDLLHSIRSALAAHPDVDASDAYVHFLMSERVVRFHDEGEDRHRSYVWPIAPFFGRDFLRLARAAPARWKRGRRLYRAFLMALAPDVAAQPLAHGRPAPASRAFVLEYALRDAVRNSKRASTLYRRLRPRSVPAQSGFWRSRLDEIVRDGRIPPVFNPSAIADPATPATEPALALLVTALSATAKILKP